MRRRTAVIVVGVAAALGALTGVVLPDRPGTAVAGPASTSPSVRASTPNPTPSRTPSPTPSPSPSGIGPVQSEDLLTAADLAEVGLDVETQDPDVRLEPIACDGDSQSLDDIASSGPPLQRLWDGGPVGASQQAVVAKDVDEARDIVGWITTELEACQKQVPTHWVYGPTHTEKMGPEVTATWIGSVNGELNTTGKAPKGERISGGIGIVRNGERVAVFDIHWCASAGDTAACVEGPDDAYKQLSSLTRSAALRLG